jgi:hypothetical protein
LDTIGYKSQSGGTNLGDSWSYACTSNDPGAALHITNTASGGAINNAVSSGGGGGGSAKLMINNGDCPADASDFAVAQLLVWPRWLSQSEMTDMAGWFNTLLGLPPLAAPPPPPPPVLAMSPVSAPVPAPSPAPPSPSVLQSSSPPSPASQQPPPPPVPSPPPPPPPPPPPALLLSVEAAACAPGAGALRGASTVTYTLAQTAGASAVTLAAAINAALAAGLSSSVAGLEAAGVSVDWASHLGGSGALASLATGLRCGTLVDGVLSRSGFPAAQNGTVLALASSAPWSAPAVYPAAAVTLVCSSCLAVSAPATAACTSVAHRFNATGVAAGRAAYDAADEYGAVVAVSGAVTNVSDVGSSTAKIPPLFNPLPYTGAVPSYALNATTGVLLGATSDVFLALNPGGQFTPQAQRAFVLGGSALTLLLTFQLPAAAAASAAAEFGLVRLGAFTPGEGSYSQKSLGLSVTSAGSLRAHWADAQTAQAADGSGSTSVFVGFNTSSGGVLASADGAVDVRAWTTVAFTLNSNGTAHLYASGAGGVPVASCATFRNQTSVSTQLGVTATTTYLSGANVTRYAAASLLAVDITALDVLAPLGQLPVNYTAAFADLQLYSTALSGAQLAALWSGQASPGCSLVGAPLAPPPPPPLQAPPPASKPPPLLPSPPLPAPPAPSLAPGSTFVVSATATLAGYSASTFGVAQRAAFATALSEALWIPVEALMMTVSGAAAAGRRRSLLQTSSVVVAFSFAAPDFASAGALSSSITALAPDSFATALQAGGLSALLSVAISAPALSVRTGSAPPPVVGAIAATPSASPVNPSSRLTLSASGVSSSVNASSLTLQWSLVSGPSLELSDTTKVGTSLTSATLGLLPGALSPGGVYVFKLSATDANGEASARITITVARLPTNGVLSVLPTSGMALATPFTLLTSGWTDANANATGAPLSYIFSYTIQDRAGEASILTEYSDNATLAGVLLPAGTINVQVSARNALGGVSAAPAVFSVGVAQQVFASAADQSTFLTTLTATASSLSASAAVALVTGAAAMLNDPSSPLNTNSTAAAEVRTQLLDALSGSASSASTPAALQSTASAVALLVSNPEQVSAAGADSALSILSSLSSAGSDGRGVAVTAAASAAVADGLSSIAAAAQAPSGAVATSVLSQVSNVVDQLAESQLASLTTPGEPPVTVYSSAIQMRVQLDAPDAGSRLFSEPLTVVGSASSFSPMPASLFAGATGAVRTRFSSLTFDPFGLDTASTGVTRLAFSTPGGVALEVANLHSPIAFTLPVLATLADGAKAECQYWDTTALRYSTRGCAGVPDPRPPGHALSLVPDFVASSDADMALSWQITGPLVDANCFVQLLDCSQLSGVRRVAYPNPAAPLLVPGVACDPSVSDAPMRVFVGSKCRLWQPNELNCSWSNVKQAFVGGGCVASGAPVQCACRHLTDFAGANKPSLPMCSLADMTSLQPADILTKLRTLFIVVIVLFAAMHIGALLGWLLDLRHRRTVLARLQAPDTGHSVTKDGTWLWRFHIAPLTDELAAPSGSAVVLAEIMGLPFARLRVCIPDELLSSDIAACLGRRHAFSRTGMESALPQHREHMQRMGLRRASSMRRTSISPVLAKDAAAGAGALAPSPSQAAATRAEELESLVGTALVLAFLQVAALVPVIELAQRGSAAKRAFADVTTPAGCDFSAVHTTFLTLLGPGCLTLRRRWLLRARLFRLILSQSTEGFWDASSTVAFALEAREARETDNVPCTWLSRLQDALSGSAEMMEDQNAAVDAITNWRRDAALSATTEEENDAGTPGHGCATGSQVDDCPLTCPVSAIVSSLPARLASVQLADPSIDVLRVWTTLTVIAGIERLNVSWLWVRNC